MTYSANIPQSTDDPADSQQDILNNFSQLNTQFAVNHTALTAVSNNGYHTKIFFPTGLGADPNLAKPLAALYTKLDGSSKEQLYFQNDSTANDIVQLTGATPTNAGSNYFIQTPFGLKLAWGQFTAVGTSATITFAGTFTTVQACVGVQIDGSTGGSRACTVKSGSLINTGVQFFVSNSGASGYYFAIGV